MNIFAGNFSLEKKVKAPDLDFDIVQTSENSYFIMWADESLTSSKDVIEFIEQNFGKTRTHDISIEWEDELEIISSEYEIGAYECVSFQWANVTYEDILERFADSSEAVCIREAEQSDIYENRIIKVDFMY